MSVLRVLKEKRSVLVYIFQNKPQLNFIPIAQPWHCWLLEGKVMVELGCTPQPLLC